MCVYMCSRNYGGEGAFTSLCCLSPSRDPLLYIILHYNIIYTRVKSRILLLPISIAKRSRSFLLLYAARIKLSVAVALRSYYLHRCGFVLSCRFTLAPPLSNIARVITHNILNPCCGYNL